MLRDTRATRRQALTIGASTLGLIALGSGIATADSNADNVRYAGYSPEDYAQPYARFMTKHTAAPQPAITAAYAGPPTPASLIPEISSLTADLGPTGYSHVETGYGQTVAGTVWAASHTLMPRVTPAMWDWWFGWHLTETARYKLWHPDAHLFAEVSADRRTRSGSDRDRYIGSISYVDEYIGQSLQQLAIAFHDPRDLGFTLPSEQTVIVGRVGSSIAPIDLGWVAHQVRPIDGGSEMRSRFYLRVYGVHALDVEHAARAVQRGAAADPRDLVPGVDLARELMLHCGQEMNHLARFLPELHSEFRQ